MIVIENGSGVVGANSYATTDDLITYAEARNITLPTDTKQLEALLIQAMDYLATKKFKGEQVTELPFPRTGIGCDNAIPKNVIKAQIVLAISAINTPLLADKTPQNSQQVASQQVGSVKVTYHDSKNKQGSDGPVFTQAESLLSDFYDSSKSGLGGVGVAFLTRS
ncbi:MAG: hypothetical protein KGV56_03355 [Gammaproteobacteria bacterium]|nr:hypothetical protein [Gammaproteobacteria bacterium]